MNTATGPRELAATMKVLPAMNGDMETDAFGAPAPTTCTQELPVGRQFPLTHRQFGRQRSVAQR